MSNFIQMQADRAIGNPAPMSLTTTVQQYPVGYRALGEDRQSGATATTASGRSNGLGIGEFVYAQGSDVTAIGQFVHVRNGSAVLLNSANSASFFPIGVAAGNLSATNVFGWVQVQGLCDYARGTNSSVGAGAALYFCATAGLLNTAAGAGSRVIGIVAPASYTSSQSASMTVQLWGAHALGVTAGL